MRIFAVLTDDLKISNKDWGAIQGEIGDFLNVIPQRPGVQDYCTLHQVGQTPATWYWESMNHSLHPDDNWPKNPDDCHVRHRPFEWLNPEALWKEIKWKYVAFCLVYAANHKNLPPARIR